MTRLALAICLVAAAATAPFAATGAPSVRTRPCTARETRAVVFAFATAWTRGDTAALDRLVAPEPHFRWVSTGPPGARLGAHAFDRRELRSYIGRRHARHDRLTMRWFRFNGSDLRGAERFGHFEFTAVRDADDWPLALDHLRHGKGAIVCSLAKPALAVWSLG
jgi:hypothetical protein